MKIETLMRIAMIAMVAILAGCGSYYKVTDPASKRVYYTEDFDQSGAAPSSSRMRRLAPR